jgi:hypothetical protein
MPTQLHVKKKFCATLLRSCHGANGAPRITRYKLFATALSTWSALTSVPRVISFLYREPQRNFRLRKCDLTPGKSSSPNQHDHRNNSRLSCVINEATLAKNRRRKLRCFESRDAADRAQILQPRCIPRYPNKGVFVVSLRWESRSMIAHRGVRVKCVIRGRGDAYSHRCSAIELALNADGSAVHRNDTLHDRKPKAGVRIAAGASAISAIKTIEDQRKIFRIDSRTRVDNVNFKFPILTARYHLHRPGARGVSNRVC